MRRVRMPPQLPPPGPRGPSVRRHHRVPAPPPPPPPASSSRPPCQQPRQQPQFTVPAADLLLVLPLRAPHAPGTQRGDFRGPTGEQPRYGELERSYGDRTPERAKAIPNEIQSTTEGENARICGASGMEDSKER